MIRTVQNIKAFGVFSGFRWPTSLPEFKQFNLMYGWNYSGKTTLSRAFRCFEQQQPHPDFSGAQVQLKAGDGTVHHLSLPRTAPVFRVFNSDFVRENLIFAEGSATPILVLGVEDIAKQKGLKTKREEREALALRRNANATKKNDKETAIEKALTRYARDSIKNPLARPSYDKRDFQQKVKTCMDDTDSHLLDDKSLSHSHSVYSSTDKKLAISPKEVSFTSVAQLKKKTTSLLARVVTANNPIPRLTDNPAVESWVKEGRPLHDGTDICQFCGQPLPTDLVTHLTDQIE